MHNALTPTLKKMMKKDNYSRLDTIRDVLVNDVLKGPLLTEDNFSIVFKKQWLKTSCDGYASGRTASRMAHIRNIRSRRLIDT